MSPSPPHADGSLGSIREAICRRIAAAQTGAGRANDAGIVHRYQRYASQESALRALYVTRSDSGADVLHGWYVTRVGTLSVPDSAGYVRTVHRWRIVGLRALDDPAQLPAQPGAPASELLHDAVIESIRSAFLADDTLGRDGDGRPYVESITWEGRQGLQVDDSGPAMWCRTLVHMTRCTLVTVCSEAVGDGADLDDLLRAGIAWDIAPPHYDAGDAATDTIGEVADVSDLVPLTGPTDGD